MAPKRQVSNREARISNNPSSSSPFLSIDLNVPSSDVVRPLGFVPSTELVKSGDKLLAHTIDESKLIALKSKRAMEMAQAPGRNAFMSAFMMWMTGNSLHIFSIMIVGMAVLTPIKTMLSVQTYFKPVEMENVNLFVPKVLFVCLNLMGLGIALYKCFNMGLLPLSSSDWVSMLDLKLHVEN